MSNLRLINETEVASGVTSVNITDVFSADFDIYYASFDVGTGSAGTSSELRLLNSTGTVISASEYDMARLGMPANASFTENKFKNADSIEQFNYSYSTGIGGGNSVYFFNPYDSSSYTFIINQGSFWNGSNGFSTKQIGVHKSVETIRGFNLLRTSGTWTANTTIRTYGLRVDS